MFDANSMQSTSVSSASSLWRFATPLIVLGAFTTAGASSFDGSHSTAAGLGFDPPTADATFEPPADAEDGDDVGTLPAFWGGDDGLWFLGNSPTALHPSASDGLLQRPALALVGPPAAVLAAVESGVGNGGGAYVIQEWLPSGELRISFHGSLLVSFDTSTLSAGLVRAELVVVDAFGPAQAALSHQGVWSDIFELSGGSFGIPTSTLVQTGTLTRQGRPSLSFGAIGSLGERYKLQFATQGERIWAAQGTF